MKEFASSTYNQFYVPTEIKLTTATAKMFNCDFVILEDKTQFHFYPKLKPLDSSEHNQLFSRYKKIITEGLQNILGKSKDYDISINVKGGGLSGQAGAIRLGISRALIVADPDNRPLLKSNGLLTRDSRKVERKKPGQPGARKKFQFSKR